MASRFTICLLFATWMSVAGRAEAQLVPFLAPEEASGYGQPGAAPAMSPYESPYMGALQAGYNPEMQTGGAEMQEPYVMPYAEPSYLVSNPPEHEPLWQPQRPIEHFLTEMFADSFIRLEYLQWDMNRPGNQMLGAPLASSTGVNDPRKFFPVYNGTGGLAGFAKVLNMSPIAMRHNQGIRGTFGTRVGDDTNVEANFWALAQRTKSFSANFLPQTTFFDPRNGNFVFPPVPLFVGTTTLLHAQPSNNVFLWDQGFRVSQTSQFWGTELKVLNEHGYFGPGTKFQTLYGFQYVQFHDRTLQVGRASGGQVGVIDSDVLNNIYGPTVGFRSEYATKWFTLGAEPKAAIALDSQRGQVMTNHLRSSIDPRVYHYRRGTSLSPIMQLSLYAKVRLNSYLNVFVSFDGTWLSRVGRSYTGISYNDNGSRHPADIKPKQSYESVFLHGLTVGGEVLLW